MNPFVSAIRDGRRWLDRFTRLDYRKAFRDYTDFYWEPCHAQLDAAAEDLAALAEQTIRELEEGHRKARFWNRGTLRFDEKQTIIKYLCPMLLAHGEENFARELQEAWSRRWPKDGFGIASYEDLDKSFVNVIMGITLKNDR